MGMGLGDAGLFTDTSGNITYENGSVGPAGSEPGMADAVIDDSEQFTSTGRLYGGSIPIDQVTFQTMSMININSDTLTRRGSGLTLSDERTVTGPYVDLVFPWVEEVDKFKNVVIGYRYYHTSLGNGPQFMGQQLLSTFATTYTYTYDYILNPPTSFPFTSTFGLIYDQQEYDDDNLDFDGGLLDPRTTSSTEDTFAALKVVSQSTIDLELHEIPIGFECGRQIGDLEVSLTGGMTLNLIDLSLTSRSYYYQYGLSNMIYSRVSRTSESEFKVGAYAGINVTYPLNDNGSWFLNFHASYRWVDSFVASNQDISAVIDLSSFEGGVGISILLD